MLVHCLEIQFEMVCNFDMMENNLFNIFNYLCINVFTYIFMPHNMKVPYFYLPYFHIFNDLVFAMYSGTFLLYRRSLHAFNLFQTSNYTGIIFRNK